MKKCSFVATGLIAVFLTLFSPFVFADDVIDIINITVPVSCTLSGTNLLHNDSIQNGQYKNNIGSANIKATCNDVSGFAVYAVGYTNEEYGNNKMQDSSLGTTYDITTGKYVSGTTTNSVWSMKLTPVSGTYAPTIRNDASYNYTNFEVIPSEYTKVAYSNSSTDVGTGSTGSNFTTTYAVYASTTQPAGTYTGKVKFTLVHPQNEVPAQPIACEGGKICYNANTSTVTGQMGKQTAGNSAEVTLYAPNFKRDGYGFAGWNTAYDYSGTTYGPNQTITTPSDTSTNGLSLYAVWVPSAGTLQNWNGCSGLAQGSVTALTDARDNDTYAVAKLADNKCWMIENLRLADKDSGNNDIDLDSTNTHNPSTPLNNSWYYKNQQGTLTTSNHLSATSDPTSTNPDTAWCQTNSSDCDDQSMLATNNTTLFTNNTSSSYSAFSNVYSYGNYYNWYSATAGHGKYGSSYGDGYHTPGDICPAGWHLPKGASKANEANNEFWSLVVTELNSGVNPANYDSSGYPFYTGDEAIPVSNALRLYPNNFVYSGYANGSLVSSRNAHGIYWSASGVNSFYVYYLDFTITSVAPGTNNNVKYGGRMVRCIAGT